MKSPKQKIFFCHLDRYDYEAQQLANLRVTVSDEISQNAVSDVRIILSGPDRFRAILTIGEDGDVSFPRLEPGDYFVIFEKKEYRFNPNKIELNLTGNEHLDVAATRYQFTAYGKLGSLSNKQFPNYKVEGTRVLKEKIVKFFLKNRKFFLNLNLKIFLIRLFYNDE